MPESIDKTFDVISERYGIILPMGDLIYSSPENALIGPKTTGGWMGREDVDGVSCDHLAFQDVGADWQIWIPASGDALPKRLQVTFKKRKGEPTHARCLQGVEPCARRWPMQPSLRLCRTATRASG